MPASRTPSTTPDRYTVPFSTAKRQEADGWERLANQELARSEDFRERAEEHWERARLCRVEADASDQAQEEERDLFQVRQLSGGPVSIAKREAG